MKSTLDLLQEHLTSFSSVTSDSREVGKGTAFVAVRGGTRDGHRFIAQAVKDGAILVIGEEPCEKHAAGLGATPYVQVTDSREALAFLAAHQESHPSHSMTMVGVTGTSGKTTTTYLVESILQAAGFQVGVIGTVNFRFGDKVYPSTHTTPGPVELQKLLAQMKAEGCTAVVMEVSSHALKQHRASYIAFDAVLFTNLSREHLDFHPDMEDYYLSKAKLFDEVAHYSIHSGKRPFAAITGDDEYGKRLLTELRATPKPEMCFASFGLASDADISARELKINLSGIQGEAAGVGVRSALTGLFNAQNILGAIAVGQGLHLPSVCVSQGLEALKVVPGRLERVPNEKGVHVLVDYAHKPDALEKVLQTLREVRAGHRLITVFGCGGDRDRTKRPVMGRMAVELSDHAIVTSDNPRTEKPEAIIQEIVAGMQGHGAFTIEPDRKNAIFAAIRMAQVGDLVLIAGKGHEDYQIIADPSQPGGTRKIHFDDREVAEEALRVHG